MNRELRRVLNTKQNNIDLKNNVSISTMTDGQLSISQERGKPLYIAVKKNNRLHKTYLSSDGNQIVDKKLTISELEVTKSYNDYRIICHNFSADLNASKAYMPWFNNRTVDTDMDAAARSFLAPYDMVLHKLIIRPETLSSGTPNFTFGLDKQSDGSTTVNSVATFTYEPTLVSNTMITVKRNDGWSALPKINAGEKVGLSIQAASDTSGNIDWFITTVWEIKIKI